MAGYTKRDCRCVGCCEWRVCNRAAYRAELELERQQSERRQVHDERDRRHRAHIRAKSAAKNADKAEQRRAGKRRVVRYSGPIRWGYVYRLYSSDGRLLYIGKTYCVRGRFFRGPSSHSQSKPWWPEVSRVDVTVYRTEADALEAEKHAIREEYPLHNVNRPQPSENRPSPLHRYVGTLTD